MKKIILFFAATLAFSCSSDDKQSADPILGTWKPVTEVHLNTTNNTEENVYEVCDMNTRLTFSNTGSLTNMVSSGQDASNCETVSIPNVTYFKNGSNLTITFPGVGEMTSTVTFSNNNNSMKEVSMDGPYRITVNYVRQ